MSHGMVLLGKAELVALQSMQYIGSNIGYMIWDIHKVSFCTFPHRVNNVVCLEIDQRGWSGNMQAENSKVLYTTGVWKSRPLIW